VTQTNDGLPDETESDSVVIPFRRREVEVQVPDAAPVVTPLVASALLRLLLNAHRAAKGERAA
jgi:hypothetical protein